MKKLISIIIWLFVLWQVWDFLKALVYSGFPVECIFALIALGVIVYIPLKLNADRVKRKAALAKLKE